MRTERATVFCRNNTGKLRTIAGPRASPDSLALYDFPTASLNAILLSRTLVPGVLRLAHKDEQEQLANG